MEDSNYHYLTLSREGMHLLMLAGLPLIDGFYLAFLATDLWQDPWRALTFGLTAFSGAGCVSTSVQLPGSFWARIAQVVEVYIVVGVGALVVGAARPFFADLLPINLYLFTGVFLVGLGFWITEVPILRRVALWMGFEAAVKAMIAASVVHGMINGVTWRFSLDPKLLPALAWALGAGFALTTGGAAIGVLLGKTTDQRYLKLGAGTSLVLMGLSVLGVAVPSVYVLAPLVIGCLASVTMMIQQTRRKGNITAARNGSGGALQTGSAATEKVS